MDWETVGNYFAARMQEPSTYVGLGAMVTGIGIKIAPEYWNAITFIGLGIGGFLATVIRERKKTTPAEIKEIVKDTVKPTAVEPGK